MKFQVTKVVSRLLYVNGPFSYESSSIMAVSWCGFESCQYLQSTSLQLTEAECKTGSERGTHNSIEGCGMAMGLFKLCTSQAKCINYRLVCGGLINYYIVAV